jgi:arylsulfatase A-like enzyme
MRKSLKSFFFFLFTTILFILLSCSGHLPEKPNIVLYITDDLSWWDLGCNGNGMVRTPNVDLLADEGMSMTHIFTASTMCLPSRSALYTGLSPHRNGCHMNHGRVEEGIQILPDYLKPLGYHVALAGKRHIKPPVCSEQEIQIHTEPGIGQCISEYQYTWQDLGPCRCLTDLGQLAGTGYPALGKQ